jgi:hypothetical protein
MIQIGYVMKGEERGYGLGMEVGAVTSTVLLEEYVVHFLV